MLAARGGNFLRPNIPGKEVKKAPWPWGPTNKIQAEYSKPNSVDDGEQIQPFDRLGSRHPRRRRRDFEVMWVIYCWTVFVIEACSECFKREMTWLLEL